MKKKKRLLDDIKSIGTIPLQPLLQQSMLNSPAKPIFFLFFFFLLLLLPTCPGTVLFLNHGLDQFSLLLLLIDGLIRLEQVYPRAFAEPELVARFEWNMHARWDLGLVELGPMTAVEVVDEALAVALELHDGVIPR